MQQPTWQHPALKHLPWPAGNGGGAAAKQPPPRGWSPHLPLGKLALLLALLAGASALHGPAPCAAASPGALAPAIPSSLTAVLPPPALLLAPAGVVASDMLKLAVPCPSLSYWLRATAMIPVTLATLFAVRWEVLLPAPRSRPRRQAGRLARRSWPLPRSLCGCRLSCRTATRFGT